MNFLLLGSVEVRTGDRAVNLGGNRQRRVLAALMLHPNKPVSIETLIAAVWDHAPPASARRQVQNSISALRQALTRAGLGGAVHSEPASYLLRVRPGQLDVDRFDELVARSQVHLTSDPGRAAESLRQALALWRGPALAGLGGFVFGPAAAALEDKRAAALERLADLDLAAGRPEQVVADLTAFVRDHPFHERAAAQLMLALARCGRQAQALQVYAEIRDRLADELGVEPGADLAGAHLRVLRQEVGAAGAAPVPAQLPPDIAAFAGRAGELAQLDALLDTVDGDRPASVVVSAIQGTAGIGKTALAVHWAHRVASRFPDGQLYVNLRGFHPDGSAVSPSEALRGFLDALQVPAQRVPPGTDAQVGLYRSLLAGKRMLVVLDNARDAEQVRPLLPGAPGCMALVTSRNQLTSLVATEGAHPFTLHLLSDAEARELLAGRLGAARVAAEPAAVDQIVARCARLPLALSIVAARAATRDGFPLEVFAGELSHAGGRGLDALAAGDAMADVRSVFSWSYRALSPRAARLFRLLGLHPGPDTTVPAAASLVGEPPRPVRAALAELTAAHLLFEHSPGRYTCHDLLRAYAVELAGTAETPADRRAAVHRVLDHYLRSAYAAARLLYPHRDPVSPPAAQPGVTAVPLATNEQALAWFFAECRPLRSAITQAAAAGFDTHTWQLAWTMVDFFDFQGRWRAIAATQREALAAATRLGERLAQAYAYRGMAGAAFRLDQHDEALELYLKAIEFFAAAGDIGGEARTHLNRATALELIGRHRDALDHAHQALARYRAAGHRSGEADALNAIGWYHAHLGEHESAVTFCRQALQLLRDLGDQHGQADTWDSLGYVHRQLRRYPDAADCYREAAGLYRALGDRRNEADTMVNLGDTYESAGDRAAAVTAWRHAATIFEELNLAEVDDVRARVKALEPAE